MHLINFLFPLNCSFVLTFIKTSSIVFIFMKNKNIKQKFQLTAIIIFWYPRQSYKEDAKIYLYDDSKDVFFCLSKIKLIFLFWFRKINENLELNEKKKNTKQPTKNKTGRKGGKKYKSFKVLLNRGIYKKKRELTQRKFWLILLLKHKSF